MNNSVTSIYIQFDELVKMLQTNVKILLNYFITGLTMQ